MATNNGLINSKDPGLPAEFYRTVGGAAADTVDALTGLGAMGANYVGGLINHNPGLKGTSLGQQVPQPWASGNRLMREVIPAFTPAGIETSGAKAAPEAVALASKVPAMIDLSSIPERSLTAMLSRRGFLKGATQGAIAVGVASTIPKALTLSDNPGLKELLGAATKEAAAHDAHVTAMNAFSKMKHMVDDAGDWTAHDLGVKATETSGKSAEDYGIGMSSEDMIPDHADQAIQHFDKLDELHSQLREAGVPEDMLPKPTAKPSLRAINKFTKDFKDNWEEYNESGEPNEYDSAIGSVERLQNMHNLRAGSDDTSKHGILTDEISKFRQNLEEMSEDFDIQGDAKSIIKESNRLSRVVATKPHQIRDAWDSTENDRFGYEYNFGEPPARLNTLKKLHERAIEHAETPEAEEAHRSAIKAINKAENFINDPKNIEKLEKLQGMPADEIYEHANGLLDNARNISESASKTIPVPEPKFLNYRPKKNAGLYDASNFYRQQLDKAYSFIRDNHTGKFDDNRPETYVGPYADKIRTEIKRIKDKLREADAAEEPSNKGLINKP